jgi:transcriptional regulator with XRE-family HTH domain
MVDSKGKTGLGDYVRSAMKRKGLTLRDIERNSGGRITDGYVSGIINGEAKNLTVEKLKALSAGLGVDVVDLFEAACGNFDQAKQQPVNDPSHSLMVLALMQKVIISQELTEILQEIVRIPPDDRRMVLRALRTLNEAGSGSKRHLGVI